MYPHYGDMRYPAEFGPGQGQMPMDPSVASARYGYSPYYVSKAPDGGQFGGMGMIQRVGQPYGGKPGAMAAHEGMYGQGWGSSMQSQAYIGHPGAKPAMGKADYSFPGQVSFVRATFLGG